MAATLNVFTDSLIVACPFNMISILIPLLACLISQSPPVALAFLGHEVLHLLLLALAKPN